MGTRPEHALTIRTYEEFRSDIVKFAEGKYNFILCIGNSGLAKSETVEKTLGKNAATISGSPTPWGFYQWAYDNMDKTLILDDVAPNFYKQEVSNSLFKNLTETRRTKTLRWATAAAGGDKEYPTSFQTTSRVIVLVNDWKSMSEHVRAIEGRATTMIFDPSPTEVHNEVGRWFADQEVYDFVYANRRFITKPNMRLYVKALEQKRAGSTWRKRTLEMMVGDVRLNQLAEILTDPSYTSNNQRQEAFVKAGYGSRTTFYEYLKEFRFFKSDGNNDGNIILGPANGEQDDEQEEQEDQENGDPEGGRTLITLE